ncbi:MAG: hypothetical protein M0R06_17540 [Sphaerochaeta sp.]|nr:hypothetical protein [Sphaerochaeta sp.]
MAMLDFARDNNLVITPAGYDYFVDNYLEFGHCVCDKTRPVCPCPQALEDVKEIGHCKCRLFFRDYDTFKKMYCDEEAARS